MASSHLEKIRERRRNVMNNKCKWHCAVPVMGSIPDGIISIFH